MSDLFRFDRPVIPAGRKSRGRGWKVKDDVDDDGSGVRLLFCPICGKKYVDADKAKRHAFYEYDYILNNEPLPEIVVCFETLAPFVKRVAAMEIDNRTQGRS